MKHMAANTGDAGWNRNAGQAATVPERSTANGGDTVAKRDVGQAGTGIE